MRPVHLPSFLSFSTTFCTNHLLVRYFHYRHPNPSVLITKKWCDLVVGTFISFALTTTSDSASCWYSYTFCTNQVASNLVGTIQALTFFDSTFCWYTLFCTNQKFLLVQHFCWYNQLITFLYNLNVFSKVFSLYSNDFVVFLTYLRSSLSLSTNWRLISFLAKVHFN